MINWQMRAGRGGVCDFRKNFDFYFKWLTNKVMSCFIISDEDQTELTSSINWDYFKMNLILDGQICITDFNDKLYACIGNRGGTPNEYYVPTRFLIANPVLKSKEVEIGKTGVVIYNTKIDHFVWTGESDVFSAGLCDLIEQTATLLADNIISINCSQINARVTAFFTADSQAQAAAGEAVLKRMYAGNPYAILRSDLIEKLLINPINNSSSGQNITELVELHNYIIANFFQSIGIKSNNIMKRERLIRDEIESQDDFLQVSILEILSSWQQGLDEVNELYGTSFHVKLNPVLLNELIQQLDDAEGSEDVQDNAEGSEDVQDSAEGSEDVEDNAESSEDVQDSAEGSEDVEDNAESSEDVQDSAEGSEDVQDNDEGSEDVQDSAEGSEDVEDNAESSEDVQDSAEGSEDVQDNDEGSEDVQDNAEGSEDVQDNAEGAEGSEDAIEEIEEKEQIVQEVVDLINDAPDDERGEQDVQPKEEAAESDAD